MTFPFFLLGTFCVVFSGYLGIVRMIFISLFGISGFLTFAIFRACHDGLVSSLSVFLSRSNSSVLSFIFLILFPLGFFLLVGIKFLLRLGLGNYLYLKDHPGFVVADRIFSTMFGGTIFVIILWLVGR